MSIRKMIIGFFVCLFIAMFADQTLSQTRESESTREVTKPDSWVQQWQRTHEQRRQQWEMQNKKRIEQLEKRTRSESAKRLDESMKQALRATERQWKVIKPRLDKVDYLSKQAKVSMTPAYYRRSRTSGGGLNIAGGGGFTGGGGSTGSGANVNGSTETSRPNNQQRVTKVEEGWKWSKAWEKKAPSELTKGERICEELLELLEDKGSKQEEIERKVEALREVRKEADKQLAQAQQELRKVLTFRQEATLVLMRYLN